MIDILDLAEAEVGYRERADGWTKFGAFLDAQFGTHGYATADWCGATWLSLLSKIPGALDAAGGLRLEYAEVEVWRRWFAAHGRLSHDAAPRRFVWYDWRGTPPGANHMGMVKERDGSRMLVYEGNHNNELQIVDRPIDDQVMGFGEWWSHIDADEVAMVVSLGC